MRNSGPFYLAVNERPKIQVWYKRQRMGVKSINSFMKNMASQADIQGKKSTNHSARKTLVKKLKAANQSRSAIIGVTGHTNERSPADYLHLSMLCRRGKGGRAWGVDLIVFVGLGVGHLTDLVLPGEGIFESFFARRGDI